MRLHARVISQQPPGGRCTLYASYADVLSHLLDAQAELVISAIRDAHGNGSPSLWLNHSAIQPADGVILMPADILKALDALGVSEEDALGLAEALDAALDRMLEEEG